MNKNCTLFNTTSLIGKKWTLLIVAELYKGEKPWKRYSEIKRRLPDITSKMLSTRLKELLADTILIKRVNAETVPITSEYSLTDSGTDLVRIISEIKTWALKWKFDNEHCLSTDCKHCKF